MEQFPNIQKNTQENIHSPKVDIEPDFFEFVPQEFLNNPVGYFEHTGKNIKTGDIKYDEEGEVREDPTAVKDLPNWKNTKGKEIRTIGKRINTSKGVTGESNNPFHEYQILEKLAQMKLPAARPIAKAEQAGTHIIIMERIPGIRWSEKSSLNLKEKGYSDEDIADLLTDAEDKMNALKRRFDEAGIIRSWKLKDMVFEIDTENKKIKSMLPTDWERTRIKEQG